MTGIQNDSTTARKNPLLSLDGWAVTVALLLALFIRLGVLKHIPW